MFAISNFLVLRRPVESAGRAGHSQGHRNRHSNEQSCPEANCPVWRGRAQISIVAPLTKNHAFKVVAHFPNPTVFVDTRADMEIV
jgi:hypothetical protein